MREAMKPCSCDLTTASLWQAIIQLGEEPVVAMVHSWDMSAASRALWDLGLKRVSVEVDPLFDTFEWSVMSHTRGIHSRP